MFSDLRFAFRLIGHSPAHSATVILILALGIGATTAIFSLLNAVLLKPVPYPEPERIMALRQRYQEQRDVSIGWLGFQDWKHDNHSFATLGVGQRDSYALTGRGPAERLNGAAVSVDYLRTVGLQPQLGRIFTEEEDCVGAPGVVVLGHALWQNKFGGASDILGQSLTLNGKSYTVIGVMPADMTIPRNAAFWMPIAPLSDNPIWQDRGNNPGLFALGRLKPGVTVAQARADLRAIGERLNRDFPKETAGHLPYLEPLMENITKDYRGSLWLLFGAVSLLLLVACANVASLQVARSLARQRELSIRAALGSSRSRLMRQLFVENLVIAAVGGVLGVGLACASLGLIRALSPDVPRFQAVQVDGVVLVFSAAAAMLTGVLSGLWPAWRASRIDLRTALQSGNTNGTASPASARTRQSLVALQVTLTLTLLAGAALFARSMANIQTFRFGFDPRNLLVFRLELSGDAYKDPIKRTVFYDALKTKLNTLPGVISVGYNLSLPLRTHWDSGFNVEGRPRYPDNAKPGIEVGVADPDFFKTIGLPLLRGRTFDATDKAGGQRVVIIDQRMAEEIWPGENAVGKAILWGGGDDERTLVVGVVPTVAMNGYEGDSGPKLYQAYFAQSQFRVRELYAVLRTTGGPRASLEAAHSAVSALDPNVPLFEVATMEELIARNSSSPRLIARLVTGFSALALVLAALGLYGVVAYAVRARQREIGIRMALGALPRQVVSLMVSHGLLPLVAGLPLGILGSVTVGRLIASQLYKVSPFDAPALATACTVLVAVALAALWFPARRAARVDPMVTLRSE